LSALLLMIPGTCTHQEQRRAGRAADITLHTDLNRWSRSPSRTCASCV
jgi:hypothetical protein